MNLLAGILGRGYKLICPEGGCDSCPRKKIDLVPATLTDAPVIVVGDYPGGGEVKAGHGWAGAAGTHLRAEFAEAGIASFAYTTAIHCRPPAGKSSGPGDKEIKACLNQFVKDEVRGYPIVALAGNTAIKAFYPGIQAAKLRGNVAFHPDYPGQRFYAMYHPSYALRDGSDGRIFTRQVQRLARVLQEPADTPWRLVTTADVDAWGRYVHILESSFLSADLETDGREAWDHRTKIKSFAVAADTEEAVFWYHTDPEWDDALRLLCAYMENPGNSFLGHNIGFDGVMLLKRTEYKPVIRCQILDTMPLLYLARQDRQIGLKQATAKYEDGYRFLVHAPHTCDDVTQLGPYNSEDVIRPIQLFRRFYPALPEKTKDLFLRVSAPTSLALARVSADGFGYSMETAQRLREYTEKRRDAVLTQWRSEDPRLDLWFDAEGKAQGAHSGEGLRAYMYSPEFLALPVQATTDTGKPAADKDAVKAAVRDFPDQAAPLRHLLEIRKFQKEQDTYVLPYLRGDRTQGDGRVHASYTYTFTDTGRPSSRNPNLQNITRPDRDAEVNLRDCFIASPGNLLVQWDFSQIELRIAMCLARDPTGIAAYQAGSDLHTATGAALAKLAGRDAPTKKDRQDAKPVNFANIYGGSAYTLQRYAYSTYGVVFTDAEAQKYVDAFFGTYTHLQPWHDWTKLRLRDGEGELTSILGHTAYYKDWNSADKGAREHAERAAINMTCQGPAAYITFYTMGLAQRAVDECPHLRDKVRWVNTVYDSIMVDMPPEHITEVDTIMRRAVGVVHNWISSWFAVPLIIDRSQGPDWGHLQEIAA